MSNNRVVRYNPRRAAYVARRAGTSGVIRRVAGRAARYVPYVGQAYEVGRDIYDAGRAVYNSFAPPRTTVRSATSTNNNQPVRQAITSSNMKYGSSVGYYKGGFRAPVPVSKKTDPFLAYGSKFIKETYGKCTGNDVVYLGTSTFDLAQIASTVSVSILRKLFKKCGIDISDGAAKLRSNIGLNDGFGFRISRVRFDAPGNSTVVGYDTISGETLNSLAVNCGLLQEITDYATGVATYITSLVELGLVDDNGTGVLGYQYRMQGSLNLRNEIVHLHMDAKMIIQNRTKGANETGDNVDVVDSQPLKGKMYHFRKSHPVVKVQFAPPATVPDMESIFGRWTENNIKLFSDTTTGFISDLKEPPPTSFFANCDKFASVRLEPGSLKDCYISNVIVKYYENLLRSFAWYNGSTGARRQTVGDTVLFALEETLNSGSTNQITVQYESQYNCSSYLKTGKQPTIKVVFDQNTASN